MTTARGRRKSAIALAAMTGAVIAAATAGTRTSRGAGSLWYRRLTKPRFQPPASIFGPVWTVLYALMVLSGHRIWRQQSTPARSRALKLWCLQLGFNALWSPLFFGARRPRWALADIGALAPAAAAYTVVANKVDRTAAWMTAPYLGWLGFAAVLNAEIVRRNPSA